MAENSSQNPGEEEPFQVPPFIFAHAIAFNPIIHMRIVFLGYSWQQYPQSMFHEEMLFDPDEMWG